MINKYQLLILFLAIFNGPLLAQSPQLTQKPLNFPNPFRALDGTQIQYVLNQSATIELSVYNSHGRLIHRDYFLKGHLGGQKDLNIVDLKQTGFPFHSLSSGVYIYIIRANQSVIGKGKMAVLS